MKFHIRTLGCKMNWLDSARIAAQLQQAGHHQVMDETSADLVFINSCTVTGQADRKSRQETRTAIRLGKEVAVTGCGPKVDLTAWQSELPEARVFSQEKDLFAALGIETCDDLVPVNSRTRLPVAIQTGCDNLCQFCITRVARGAHQSIPAKTVIAQIRQAEEMGIKEIILTGINLGAWGCEDSREPGTSRLAALLTQILEHTDIPRVRISSLGPQYLDESFFDIFSDSRLCEHLHLSIQSGSAKMLDNMRRGHGVEEIYTAARQAKRSRPAVAVTADFIAGLPGESDAMFEETTAMVKEIGFAKLHVFPFSAREGTPAAARDDQIPGHIKKLRAKSLREIGHAARSNFIESHMGKSVAVLVEAQGTGLTGNYIRIKAPDCTEGSIVTRTISPTSLAEQL